MEGRTNDPEDPFTCILKSQGIAGSQFLDSTSSLNGFPKPPKSKHIYIPSSPKSGPKSPLRDMNCCQRAALQARLIMIFRQVSAYHLHKANYTGVQAKDMSLEVMGLSLMQVPGSRPVLLRHQTSTFTLFLLHNPISSHPNMQSKLTCCRVL